MLLQLGSKALMDGRDTVRDSLPEEGWELSQVTGVALRCFLGLLVCSVVGGKVVMARSEEHTSELQSPC